MVEVIFFIAVVTMIALGIRGHSIAAKLKEYAKLEASATSLLYTFNNEAFSNSGNSVIDLSDPKSLDYYNKGVKNSRFMFLLVFIVMGVILLFE